MESLKFWLWAFVVLFVLWFITGGPTRINSTNGPFIHPLFPLGSGETYGNIREFSIIPSSFFSPYGSSARGSANQSNQATPDAPYTTSRGETIARNSEFKGLVTLRTGSLHTDASREYLQVIVDPSVKKSILLTGWQVKSAVTGKGATIGKGAPLPFTNQQNQEDPIFISGGDTVYVNTGRSPINISFRVNLCTGYFGQFQEYTPSLQNDCPRPSDEPLPQAPNNFNDSCLDYLDNISSCQIQIQQLPQNIGPECASYITTKINYTSCVDAHKNDAGFYKKQWRVFLGQGISFWKNQRETIELIDNKGKIVDYITI